MSPVTWCIPHRPLDIASLPNVWVSPWAPLNGTETRHLTAKLCEEDFFLGRDNGLSLSLSSCYLKYTALYNDLWPGFCNKMTVTRVCVGEFRRTSRTSANNSCSALGWYIFSSSSRATRLAWIQTFRARAQAPSHSTVSTVWTRRLLEWEGACVLARNVGN